MENNKKNAVEYIEKTKKIYTDVSDKIWADPELRPHSPEASDTDIR